MTTNAQPATQNGRNRKRPLAETTTPLASQPATAGPSVSAASMNYFNTPPTSVGPGASNIYTKDLATSMLPPSQEDMFRHQGSVGPQGNMYDTNNQIARVPRGSQLVRMPSFNGMGAPGIPQMTPGQMPMNMVSMPGAMEPHGQHSQQMVGTSAKIDADLRTKIQAIKGKRPNIPPFVQKLSTFVNDESSDHLIRWSDSGESFLVLDEDEFSKTLIPDLFKHNNYASFVRQLNMYGFHKVVGLADGSLKTSEQRNKPPSEYQNPYFKRGQNELMWLIQKPKSKNARAKGKKGTKQEEQDSDKEDNMSDVGGGDGDVGGGFIEGIRESRDSHNHGSSGNRSRGFDFSALTAQIDAVRNHQAMISQAINRLRKDHQQLYEQSLAFQSLHDRHENSINAILTFLATVYDKSLGGHINGAVNNLFAHQVDQGQSMHRGTPGASVGPTPNGAVIPAVPTARQGVMRTPQTRRRPLLLEGGPTYSGEQQDSSAINSQPSRGNGSPTLKNTGSPRQSYQQYPQPSSIQELFTPTENITSPAESPQLQNDDHHLGLNQSCSSPFYLPSLSLPNSPIATSRPSNNAQYTTSPGMSLPGHNGDTPVPTPRSIAKALGSPFPGTAQALQDHHASLAQKSREIEELENLQTKQAENIDQLMGIMENLSHPDGQDLGSSDVDEFFNFGLQGDGFGDADGFVDDGQGELDIDRLLMAVGANGNLQNGQKHGEVLGTNPSTVTASPAASSVGSRGRDELEEDIEEVRPKRRRVLYDER